MVGLLTKKCVPCEGGIPPLTEAEYSLLLAEVDGWEVVRETKHGVVIPKLTKQFTFEDFRAAMAFLREVEELAESEGHHPDFFVQYSRVTFYLWTHAIRGLHQNDFILAAKLNELHLRFSR